MTDPSDTAPARTAPALARRLAAETIGTGALVVVVIGSGIAAQRLSPTDVGLQLLENSTATALALAVLIAVFAPISGAHFNPLVTAVDALLGRGHRGGLAGPPVLGYALAQATGAVGGAVLANLMFDTAPISISTHDRVSVGHLLGEVVATAGLITVIFTLARTGRSHLAAAVVGAYIGAAYWFTSSTSFANPAVTLGRIFTDTFAGINPTSALAFIAAQIVGAAAGLVLVIALTPTTGSVVEISRPTPSRDSKDQPVNPSRPPSVLFVCVHNAGRSQMAAGYLTALAGGRIEVRSAGSLPGDAINPTAVAVMAEQGIDISTQTPKILTAQAVQASDVVITMGCGDTCPIFPGKRYEDWTLDDPAGQPIDTVRRIRDDIRGRIQQLIADLLPETTAPAEATQT